VICGPLAFETTLKRNNWLIESTEQHGDIPFFHFFSKATAGSLFGGLYLAHLGWNH
jgi:hypothetical protein